MPRLEDRLELEQGVVLLTGVQALVRGLVDARRADVALGRRTAAFCSGYQGSPLGGLDGELARLGPVGEALRVEVRPGLNEELAATAVGATQLTGTLPDATVDGVTGAWFAKAPGLDRAADAIRHANLGGTDRSGGVVAWVGDDPAAKSSTVPSASEPLLAALGVPVLSPGTPAQARAMTRHAIALSRASGLWCAVRLVADVADAVETVVVGDEDDAHPLAPDHPAAFAHRPHAQLLGPKALALEASLVGDRLDVARAYGAANGLDRLRGARDARLGLVAAGRTAFEVREALAALGLGDDAALERHGLRLLDVGMAWPLDAERVHALADGCAEVLVVEEKRPFLEDQVRAALYGRSGAPRVTGRRDPDGAPLVPAGGELDAPAIATVLAARLVANELGRDADLAAGAARLAAQTRPAIAPPAVRAPAFCSGCPHSTSTKTPDDQLVGAGIGCHTMVLLDPAGRGDVTGVTQMGGEGAQWVGLAPFVQRDHLVQNVGDGTFAHSASLAVRWAIATGANVTFRILCNGTVAMTGGQDVAGGMSTADLTRLLEVEGVVRTVVTTEDPKRFKRARLAPNAEVRHRDALGDTLAELAATPGVTALLHDQACAAQRRRLRRRGELPGAQTRVAINERVCEGCGDCGEKTGCLSLETVDTELGPRTRVHQGSCNEDLSCLAGDCPSFVTLRGGERRAPDAPPPPAVPAPPPTPAGATIRMTGVGGTGVLSMSHVLAMAALLEGRFARGLDQTGLSQKGGAVVSDLRIGPAPHEGSSRCAPGTADVLLAFDLLAATAPAALAAGGRSRAVASTSLAPTSASVREPATRLPDAGRLVARLRRVCADGEPTLVDAEALSRALFGDHLPANSIVLGAALQRGLLPVGVEALEQALRLNGTAVERNLAALRWGRAAVAAPEEVAAVLDAARGLSSLATPSDDDRALVSRAGLGGAHAALVAARAAEARAWGGARTAERYVADVAALAARASGVLGPDEAAPVVERYAKALFRLVAYKDEAEVARLHLLEAERARLRGELGEGGRLAIHLHPPVLRAMGMQRKLAIREGVARPLLRATRALRPLRGTPVDPFGRAEVRRVERALPGELRDAVERALALRDRPPTAVAAAALGVLRASEEVRGFEDVKLAGVERFRRGVEEALAPPAAADRARDARPASSSTGAGARSGLQVVHHEPSR